MVGGESTNNAVRVDIKFEMCNFVHVEYIERGILETCSFWKYVCILGVREIWHNALIRKKRSFF